MQDLARKLHLVLRHDHVLGRKAQLIHSSVTQVDLHDFSRLTATYQLGGFHCVTELAAQHRICREIMHYWHQGAGRNYNPDRVQALNRLHLHDHFDALLESFQCLGQTPLLIGTSARPTDKNLDYKDLLAIIHGSDRPALVQFGTSWGLSPDQINRCDWVLPPISGLDGYNHLSVRCAAAIIVDRIFQTGTSIT